MWALGSVGATLALTRSGEANFSIFALVFLVIAAIAWMVTFIIDGFVSPQYALAFAQSSDPSIQQSAMIGFKASQELVIRFGLVAWILIGLAIVAYSTSILITKTFNRIARIILIAIGFPVGFWPIVAWLTGVFQPGPFTSSIWVPSAQLAILWFAVWGSIIAIKRPQSPARM